MKHQIQHKEDIKLLVDSFYEKVLKDDVIGFIFTEVVPISWDEHMPLMYSFWESMLLDEMSYRGNMMVTHLALHKKVRLEERHFDRWKQLFFETLDAHFEGEKVAEAKKRVENMAALMLYKIGQSEQPGFIQ
ncbi:MAG: group III truncated hemoglobin [Saprospiraceae bacterium]|nr:group III truncated hemoglobin [Saprospiraceae bacterium]